MNNMHDSFFNNTNKNQYELLFEDSRVIGKYTLDKNILHLKLIEADPSLRGTGAAGKFMKLIMEDAQTKDLKVIPICGYAAHWLNRHPEYHHILAD